MALLPMLMAYRPNRSSEHENDSFSVIDTEEKAYIVGMIAADGSIQEEKSNIVVELKVEDRELLDLFPRFLKGSSGKYPGGYTKEGRRPRKPSKNNPSTEYVYAYWRVTSERMVRDLKSLGIPSGKKGGKNAKDWSINLKEIPEEFHRHFWRGMVDGDGSLMTKVGREKSRKGGTSRMELKGSKGNIELFAKTCKRLFGTKAEPQETHASWVFVMEGDQLCSRATEWLYRDARISLPRKQSRAEIMIHKEKVHRKYDDLGKEKFLEMKRELGTWKAVRKELGISKTAMYKIRKRLGIEMRPAKHQFDLDEIVALLGRLGTLRRVAEHLGVRPETLYKIRKRLQEEEE